MNPHAVETAFIFIFIVATAGALFVILANAFGWYPYSKGFTAAKPPKNPAESKAESVKGGGDTTGTTKEPVPVTVDMELKPATVTKLSPTPIVTTGGEKDDHGPTSTKSTPLMTETGPPTEMVAEGAPMRVQNDNKASTNRTLHPLYEKLMGVEEKAATYAQSIICSIPLPHAPETGHVDTGSGN